MRIPFIKRESEAEKRAKSAAKEARLAAKATAWKQFWFKVKLAFATVFVVFVSVFGLLIYFAHNLPPQNYTAFPADRSSPPPPAPVPAVPQKRTVVNDEHAGMVWVEGYTRKNGTVVKGYWRRK